MADGIEIVDYDASWPGQFEAEARALRAVLPAVAGRQIEHFGSTAVPGLRAKPVIDILVLHPAPDLWQLDDARAELRFRDALRADAALARRYGELKYVLAARHGNDRDAYTEAKTNFVAEVLATLS